MASAKMKVMINSKDYLYTDGLERKKERNKERKKKRYTVPAEKS